VIVREVSFHIDASPIGKGRPRFGGGRTYTPEKTRNAETEIHLYALSAMRGQALMEGPVRLHIVGLVEMPASWSKKKRAEKNGRPHTQKPDASNVAKLVEDALNGAVYRDDAQVYDLRCLLYWGKRGRIGITVTEIET